MASSSQIPHIRYAEALSELLPPEFFRPVPSRALWFPVYVAVIAACTIAIAAGRLSILAWVPLAFVIGLSFTSLGILAHEILHGSVVETRWLRRLLGALCLAPLNIGLVFWGLWHSTHHAHTQDPARDPDAWGTVGRLPLDRTLLLLRPFTNTRSLLFPVLLCLGVTSHATALMLAGQPRMTSRQRLVTLSEFLVPLAFWISLGFWLGWVQWVFFYLIPLMIANLIINLFVITNHSLNPLDDTGDSLAGSLTVNTYRWVERLFLNFNYHAEHHLLPRMSPRYAPNVAQLLKDLWPERYHQMRYGEALQAVWRTPRVYYDHIHLIDLRNGKLYGTLGHGIPAESAAQEIARIAPN